MNLLGTGTTYPGLTHHNGVDGFWLDGVFRPIVRGGADDPTDGANSGATGSEDNSGNTDDNDKDKDNDSGSSGGEAKFTQEQLDAIIAREKSKAARGKVDPKDFGFDSQKELKAFLDKVKEEEDKAKTEAEKALEEATKKAADEARESVLSVANKRLVQAEFKIKASDHGVRFVDDAFALAQTLEDWDVEVTDDGVVTGLDKSFFESLKKAKPFLFSDEEGDDNQGGGTRRDIGAGAQGGGKPGSTEQELSEKYPALRHIR